ncbi:RNase HII [Rarobacter incanus]|uniref:Ribonuclease n=1 Tax=Rarobacter incanus TaxID=153494 RepID=A0A542SLB2_9MICO|nr:RNase HII [Rarobacter incanus]
MRQATLAVERSIGADSVLLVGMDEVGRGALAGPVCVGVVGVFDLRREVPAGLTDSKLLSAARRAELVDPIKAWADVWAIGEASPGEVEQCGIIEALRRAGRRALLAVAGGGTCADAVLLDGSHDWLSAPAARQDSLWEAGFAEQSGEPWPPVVPRVTTRVKADVECATVAAASVLAKCYRDALMVELARQHPEYGWDSNVGYGSAAHRAAIAAYGVTDHHRASWCRR